MLSNADVLQRANGAVAAGNDFDDICVFFSSDYQAHVTGKSLSGGHSVVNGFLKGIRAAFSNVEINIEILMEDGDRVAWKRTSVATQSGPYKGFPPSHKKIKWSDMIVTRFEGGLIAEDWLLTDLAEQLLRSRK